MFGRLHRITMSKTGLPSLVIVDPEKGINNLIFEAKIEKFQTGLDITKMTLDIYNLPTEYIRKILENEYDVTVEFGYEDEGDSLGTVFRGSFKRCILSREEPHTTKTTLYYYEAGQFLDYGFYNKTIIAGTDLATIIRDVCEYIDPDDTSGGQQIPYDISEGIDELVLGRTTPYYGSKNEVLLKIAEDAGIQYQIRSGVATFTLPEKDDGQINAVVFTRTIENGKIVSSSGLIGIPTLNNDGIDIKCLINPRIDIFSYVKIDNSVISNAQTGFDLSGAEFGATLDSNGIYRVVSINITMANDDSENVMELKALAKDSYNQ